MNPYVFREYDIRGRAEQDLGDRFVEQLGQALGTFFQKTSAEDTNPESPQTTRTIAVGQDCRLHSPRLYHALVKGLTSTGLHVLNIGIVPTPVLYFCVFDRQLRGGIQSTGSHNPAEDNGFKILDGIHSFFGAKLQLLRQMIQEKDFIKSKIPGKILSTSVIDDYAAFAKTRLLMGKRRFKIVVDAGNGTGGVVLVPLLRSLGFEVHELFCEMDGRFPNHHPDPTVPENLQDLCAYVKKEKAEIGLALDGDADRLGAVDGAGNMVWGDQLFLLLAKAILAEQPGATFLAEVKCSQAVYEEIEKAGGTAVMWKVGHSLLKEKMRKIGAALAGEMSGHLFFAHRYLGYDDAIYAAARLVEYLSGSPKTFQEHVASLPKLYNTPEIRREVKEQDKFEIIKRAILKFRQMPGIELIEIDGARVHFSDAWALVRASNTQAALVMRFEAATKERLLQVQAWMEQELAAIEQEMNLEAGLVKPKEAAGRS